MALEPFYRAIETHPDYAGAEVQGSDSTMIPMRIAGYGDDTAVLVPDTTARLSTTTAFSQAAGLRVNESKRLGCHAADHTIEPTPYKVRHWWPTAKQLARLQRMVNTFVWDGDFQTDQRCRSWLKLSLASKRVRDGGLNIPIIAHELIAVAGAAVHRDINRPPSLSAALPSAGDLCRHPVSLHQSGSHRPILPPATGLQAIEALHAVPRTQEETQVVVAAAAKLGHHLVL